MNPVAAATLPTNVRRVRSGVVVFCSSMSTLRLLECYKTVTESPGIRQILLGRGRSRLVKVRQPPERAGAGRPSGPRMTGGRASHSICRSTVQQGRRARRDSSSADRRAVQTRRAPADTLYLPPRFRRSISGHECPACGLRGPWKRRDREEDRDDQRAGSDNDRPARRGGGGPDEPPGRRAAEVGRSRRIPPDAARRRSRPGGPSGPGPGRCDRALRRSRSLRVDQREGRAGRVAGA